MEAAIGNELERKHINRSELAKRLHISPSNLSKFFHGKTELKFSTIIAIVREVAPEKEYEIISKYALRCSNPENVRACLEYAARHRLVDLLKKLIEKTKNMKNALTAELGEIYQFDLLRINKQLPNDFLEIYHTKHYLHNESRILIRILAASSMMVNNQFGMVLVLLDGLESEIEKGVQNEFIRNHFKVRIYRLYSIAYLYTGEIEKGREICLKIIETGFPKSSIGFAYYLLGISYVLDNAKAALEYYDKAICCFSECLFFEEIERIKNKAIPFANNYHSIVVGEETNNLEEKIHGLIKKGEMEKAIISLERIPETAFTNYLKGLCLQGKEGTDYLYKSLIMFEREGNKLRSEIPRRELINRGETWARH